MAMLPRLGWLRQMSDAERKHWWEVVATGDPDLALREFRREYEEAALSQQASDE